MQRESTEAEVLGAVTAALHQAQQECDRYRDALEQIAETPFSPEPGWRHWRLTASMALEGRGEYRVLYGKDLQRDYVNLADAEKFAADLLTQPTDRMNAYVHVLDLSVQDRFGAYRVVSTEKRPRDGMSREDWNDIANGRDA